MAANRIYIQVDFQSQSANSAINALNQNIQNIGGAAQNATNKATTGLKGFSVSVQESARSVDQLASSIAGLGLVKMLGGMVEAADQINRAKAAFQAMGASAGESAGMIERIRAIAQKSPFSFDDLLESAQRMRAFGFDLDEIPDKLNTIANTAAALGKGKAGIDQLTLALGQMKTKGLIQGQEAFRQLAEAGVNSTKYLQTAISKEMGKAVSAMDVRKMIEKQMVGAEGGVPAIFEGMKREFGQAGEAMSKLPSAQLVKLNDDFKKLGSTIEESFAPALIFLIKQVRDLVDAFNALPAPIRDTIAVLAILGSTASIAGAAFKAGFFSWLGPAIGLLKQFGGVVGTVGTALKLAFEAGSIRAFFAVLGPEIAAVTAALTAALPVVLALGVAWAAYQGYKYSQRTSDDTTEKMKKGFEDRLELAKQAQAAEDKLKAAGAKDVGYGQTRQQSYMSMTIDQLKEQIKLLDQVAKGHAKILQAQEEQAKHQMEIAQQALEREQHAAAGPIFGLPAKYSGLFREVQGNAKATGKVMEAMNTDLQVQLRKVQEEQAKERLKYINDTRAAFSEEAKAMAEVYKQHLEYIQETDKIAMQTFRDILEYEQTALEADRDQRLAELDSTHRQTLAQEIAYEEKALAIKLDYAQRIQTAKIELVDFDFQYQMTIENALHDAKLTSEGDYLARVAVLTAQAHEKIRQIVVNTGIEADKDRLEATKKTNDAIYNEQKQIYDKLKGSLDRVFDALLHKSTSIWEAIGNGLKTAILGAIKEIVTSRAAAALMRLFGYGDVSFGGGMRGLGGQQPIFGGGGGAGGGGGFLASILGLGGMGSISRPGAPGGTPGIAGPVGGLGGGGATTAPGGGTTGGLGGLSFAGLGKTAAGIGSVFGGAMMLGSGLKQPGALSSGLMSAGGGAMAMMGIASLFPALLMTPAFAGLAGAGLGLAAAGLMRGGKAGLGMSIGGGALTGAMIGSVLMPGIGTAIGAAIGAAAGAIAGTIRLLIKGADQKVRDKVKQVYGIDITEKNIRAQILQIAKEKYGGNLDLAVRSQDVQEIVQLYALSTGKNPSGMPRPMYAAAFAQSAAGLAMQPVYSNGQIVANPYTGVTTSQWASAGLYVQLNPQQANDLFEGRVVNVLNSNPGSVAAANLAATQAGASRDGQRTALMEPLTVTR